MRVCKGIENEVWLDKKVTYFVLCNFIVFTFSGIAQGQDRVSLGILDIHSSPGGNVEMVVSVVHANGIPVKGLGKENFKLKIEGKEVKEFLLNPTPVPKVPFP